MVVPAISRRFRPAYLMGGGLVVAAIGFAVLTQVDRDSGLTVLIIGSVIYSLGLSPVVILATDLIVGSAPVERAGAASAISETSSELGGALGIAIFGSIGTAIYRLAMWDAVPEALPPRRWRRRGARSVAPSPWPASSPASSAPSCSATARAAFIRAFQLTAAISAVVSLVTAIGVMVLLAAGATGICTSVPGAAR